MSTLAFAALTLAAAILVAPVIWDTFRHLRALERDSQSRLRRLRALQQKMSPARVRTDGARTHSRGDSNERSAL